MGYLLTIYPSLKTGRFRSTTWLSGNTMILAQWPFDRYVKLRVVHAPGVQGTFCPPPRVSDPDMQHGMSVTHVSWCIMGPLTIGFLWSRWPGKPFRHSGCMRNPHFYVSGKRPTDRTLREPSLVFWSSWSCTMWPVMYVYYSRYICRNIVLIH